MYDQLLLTILFSLSKYCKILLTFCKVIFYLTDFSHILRVLLYNTTSIGLLDSGYLYHLLQFTGPNPGKQRLNLSSKFSRYLNL